MNKLDAFINGFIKAAGPLPPPPPPPTPPTPPKIPMISLPHNAYTVGGLPPNMHNFVNKGGNTLNINAHGGPDSAINGEYAFQSDSNNSKNLLYNNEPLTYTPQTLAKLIGPATNNINNIYTTACNGGDCSNTNVSPNEVLKGFATPAMYRKLFPNLTNVVQIPPGHYGPLIPSQFKTNEYPDVVNIINRIIKDRNPNDPITTSLPHQYNLQGGTNWVDKGTYYNY